MILDVAVSEGEIAAAVVPVAGAVDPSIRRCIAVPERSDVKRAAIAGFGFRECKGPGRIHQRRIFRSDVRRGAKEPVGTIKPTIEHVAPGGELVRTNNQGRAVAWATVNRDVWMVGEQRPVLNIRGGGIHLRAAD